MAFGAYGEQYQGPAVDGMFTGVAQVPEANDLRTFPARNLSTVEGRWMSPDPAGLGVVDLGNPQSLNRYAYVVGNPFGLVDLTGLDPTQIYTPPITVTADGPGPISVLSSYSAPGSHCSDRCLDAAEAASYNGAGTSVTNLQYTGTVGGHADYTFDVSDPTGFQGILNQNPAWPLPFGLDQGSRYGVIQSTHIENTVTGGFTGHTDLFNGHSFLAPLHWIVDVGIGHIPGVNLDFGCKAGS